MVAFRGRKKRGVMVTAKRGTTLAIIVAMVLCMFGLCTVQAHADTDFSGHELVAYGGGTYYYDGKPKGENNNYKIYIWKGDKKYNITDCVTITQKKHTNCGKWYIKVTAKEGSGYTGSKMVEAMEIIPKPAYSLKAKYNKKAKKTTITFKMPKLRKGHYEFAFYKGKEIYIIDEYDMSKSEKKESSNTKSRKQKHGKEERL